MNFYATPDYLSVAAQVYFKGRRTNIEDVRIGDGVLRLLVVDGNKVVTTVQFLDYHEPLSQEEIRGSTREYPYAPWVVRRVIEKSEWDPRLFEDYVPAPYVDWSAFPSFNDYKAWIRAENKGLIREHERRRRRLAEKLGELEFCMDDTRADVFEFACKWKSHQLQETGVRDYFAEPRTREYFALLREKGLLTSSTLRASGRLLSVWLGYVHDGVWSGWVFTYDHDPDLRKYSLGHQLLHSMLEESHRRGHREFDFSTGDEDYKWLYSTHARLVGDCGRASMRQRLMSRARHLARKALFRYPRGRQRVRALMSFTMGVLGMLGMQD